MYFVYCRMYFVYCRMQISQIKSMKPSLRTVGKEKIITQYIDADTGEVMESKVKINHHRIVVNNENEFIQMYASLQSVIRGIPAMECRLMVELMFFMGKNNIVAITKPVRQILSENIGIAEGTCRNVLASLVKKDILVTIGRCTYKFNPLYAWKGNLSDRVRDIKYTLELELKNNRPDEGDFIDFN